MQSDISSYPPTSPAAIQIIYTLHTNYSQEYPWLIFPSWWLAVTWLIPTLSETNRAPLDNRTHFWFQHWLCSRSTCPVLPSRKCCYNKYFYNSSVFRSIPQPLYSRLYTINFIIKTLFLTISFLWTRASHPWVEYDQLMHVLWKAFYHEDYPFPI